MKKLKLMTAIIAILVFSNLLFAVNPNTETADDISTAMVNNLNNDVTLTSVQKEAIKKKTDEYANNLIQARAMTNKDDSYVLMKPT